MAFPGCQPQERDNTLHGFELGVVRENLRFEVPGDGHTKRASA
jgi:hypothetical protein